MDEKNEPLAKVQEGTATPESQKSGTNTPHHHHLHIGRHNGHRLRKLVHPLTGKVLHIVSTPGEVEAKRSELTKITSNNSTTNGVEYDVLVEGSPEHISAIREVHDHHLTRRESIRRKNEELFNEFDEVHETLGHLNEELNRLTTNAVALDASFSKFGYSAHLRTTDDDSGSTHGSISAGSASAQERHLDRSLEPLRFWKRPTIRQYFHKGLLWRSSRSGEVGSFELFTDLIYVGVIDTIGETAVRHASAQSFLQFVIVFALGYKIWSDLTVTINWFEVEDIVGRIFILFILCCLYGFNSNIEYFFENTETPGLSYYLTQRFFLIGFFLLTSYTVKLVRGTLISHAVLALITAALYIGALHTDYPWSLIPYFFAIAVDYCGGVFLIVWMRRVREVCESKCQKSLTQMLRRNFEFFPAINIEHRVERTNAFTTLVFGYSVLKVLYQSHANIGVNAFLGKGMLAIVQAFVVMWLYFDVDNWAIHVHAIRRHWMSSCVWIFMHLPLSASFILASSTLGILVLAHDCDNANPEDLAENYATESEGEISQALRWFYCVGLGISLFSMTVISSCHIHKRITRPHYGENKRRITRILVSIVLICLPLAHELSSLSLIATTTSLFVIVLILDIYGNAYSVDKFWTGGGRRDRCEYSARIKMGKKRKEELRRKMLEGMEVTLGDALRRWGSESTASTNSSRETLVEDAEWQGGHL